MLNVRRFACLMMLGAVSICASRCGKSSEDPAASSPSTPTKAEAVSITLYTDSVGKHFDISKQLAADFEKESGVHVNIHEAPQSTTESLAEVQKFLSAKSADFDVVVIDVVWPGLLKDHLIDLTGVVDTKDFFPAMIENNTISGKLLAIPFYSDAGILYYRTDLLKEYGFAAAPKTWDELEKMAHTIMDGERKKGNDRFFGITFQGAAYEGLTCDTVEWAASAGAKWTIDEKGNVSLGGEKLAKALDRRRGWIGTIAPQGVLSGKEEDARLLFQGGNAAFMRNWPYCYQLGQTGDSAVKGKFDVAPLPADESGESAACLGGWNVAVTKYSKHPEEAKKFAAFLTTRDAMKKRAIEGSYFSTRPDIYADPEVAKAIPFLGQMKDVLLHAVPRPASAAGSRYNMVSSIYYQMSHDVLSGSKPAAEAVAEAEKAMQQALAR
ncbi:ABC transporter substrate-binding protein [soil metagenome]